MAMALQRVLLGAETDRDSLSSEVESLRKENADLKELARVKEKKLPESPANLTSRRLQKGKT